MLLSNPPSKNSKNSLTLNTFCYEKLRTKGMGNRITYIQLYFQAIAKTNKTENKSKEI
ncbi:hypothetical protein ACFOPX_04725 [Helicobacter baculiformis]|uniref:OMP1651 n=1 Tax=Helicobacter baculiformis TaxID=427351 RepID=A0A1M4NGT8_9HELI|nr:hypothetical protein [Helicobacter baculiformis]SFZ71466.1 OMP1651 [Helicobacter baculiformis]